MRCSPGCVSRGASPCRSIHGAPGAPESRRHYRTISSITPLSAEVHWVIESAARDHGFETGEPERIALKQVSSAGFMPYNGPLLFQLTEKRSATLNNQPAAASQSVQPKTPPAGGLPSGLSYWMDKVVEECDRAARDLSADAVHDLRIALRRCRTMADEFLLFGSCSRWKAMKKEGGRLFRRLGELRDVQVMMEWVTRLGSPADPAAIRLMDFLLPREAQLKQEALEALGAFDRKKWNNWSSRLQDHSRRVPLDGKVHQLNALRAWEEAHQLHKKALRDRSIRSWHSLRVGLKKFRYAVENFLPARHETWGPDLKQVQDWLGDVHDLSVLWDAALRVRAFPDAANRTLWRTLIRRESQERIGRYREKALGPGSLWNVWRSGLPSPERARQAALQWLQTSAGLRAVDLHHTLRVRSLALQLFSGLRATGPVSREGLRDQRSVLHAAAIFHEAGRSASRKKHGKASARALRALPVLPGLPEDFLLHAAIIVRHHCGGLGILNDKDLAGIGELERQNLIRLTGILRLAEALAVSCDPPVARISVHLEQGSIIVEADGYNGSCRHAEKLAGARYLLEFACNQPVFIRNLNVSPCARVAETKL